MITMAKLTLSINSDVVEKAKKTLQTRSQSLSGLVEDYFKLLIKTKKKPKIDTPIVKELTGILKSTKKPDNEIYDFLSEKYK